MKKKFMLAAMAFLATVIVFAAVSLSMGEKGDGGMMSGPGGGKGMGPGMNMGFGMDAGPGMDGGPAIFDKIGALLNDPEFIDQIGLSADQVEKLRTIHSTLMKSQIRSEADIKIMRMELDELLDQKKPDKAKIDAKIDEIGKKETEMKKNMAHAMLDCKAVLSEEQCAKIKKMASDRMKGGMMDRRGGDWQDKGPGMDKGMGADKEDAPEDKPCPMMKDKMMKDK
jgi:Spy/CpxP family protein refolding chaperone